VQFVLQGKINCFIISTSTTNQGHKMKAARKFMKFGQAVEIVGRTTDCKIFINDQGFMNTYRITTLREARQIAFRRAAHLAQRIAEVTR
jgi:hypothetical protein